MWARAFRLLAIIVVSMFAGYLIGNLTPEAMTPKPPLGADFVVANLSIEPAEIQPNEIVSITVSVTNTHDTWGIYSLVLMIDGVKEGEGQATVDAGSTQDVCFCVTRDEPGNYDVFINGLSASFTVIEEVKLISYAFVSRLNDKDASQGIASDGTYLYVTGAGDGHYHIYKYNMAGVLQDSNTDPELEGTACTQVNGIFIKDAKLHVGAANGGKGFIKVFNCSDLSYVEEHAVKDHFCEGGVYDHGAWWVFYDDWNYISKYNDSWVWQADYALAFDANATRANGLLWDGDYMYINNHENATRDTLDAYHWNGAGFDYVSSLVRPSTECTQGFYKEPTGNFLWWAERHGGGAGVHNIVKTH